MPGFVVAPERFVVGICLGVRESHDSDSARIERQCISCLLYARDASKSEQFLLAPVLAAEWYHLESIPHILTH